MMAAFPIGFWNCAGIEGQSAASVRDWADAGMTLTQGPFYDGRNSAHVHTMRGILDACFEHGIRLIPGDTGLLYPGGDAFDEHAYRANFAKALADFGHHPALFGFHAGDEPDAKHFPHACRALRIQKEMAPHLTPFCNLLPWYDGCAARVGFERWNDYLDAYAREGKPDLFCYDCYAQMNPNPDLVPTGWHMYFRNLLEFGAAAQRNSIPFWTTLLTIGHFNYRCPTEDDLRWQLNTALAHGARGIMWYMFYLEDPNWGYRLSPISELGERTETFTWLSRVCRTFLRWTAPVIQKLTLRKVMHAGTCYGGAPTIDGQGLIRAVESITGEGSRVSSTPMIASEFRHEDGGDYVMIVNNSQSENTLATVVVQGNKPHARRVSFGAKEIEPPIYDFYSRRDDACILKAWMPPGHMELYRIVMES